MASTLRSSHCSHEVVRSDPGPRRMKHTLLTKYQNVVSPFLSDGILPQDNYKVAIQSIHHEAVQQVIKDLGPNPLLGKTPPPPDKSERSLTRAQRSTLSQLRSGYCRLLKDYQVRVGLAPDALCPECLYQRHTTRHLFICPATPTNLSISDLWRHPVPVMDFLLTLSSFSVLLPPPPPAPRPPPVPPDRPAPRSVSLSR